MKSVKRLASCAFVVAFAVGACSSDESTATDSTATPEETSAAPSEPATAEPEETAEVAAPSEAPEEIEIFDRLLPTEVVDGYFPSLSVNNSMDTSTGQASYPAVSKVRPKKCRPVLELQTSPLEDSTGRLSASAYAGWYLEGGPVFTERIFEFPSPSAAQEEFRIISELLDPCRTARGETPQQGSITINDGINRLDLDIDNIAQSPENSIIMTGPIDDYYNKIEDFYGLALVDNSLIWTEMWTLGDEIGNKRALNVFTNFTVDTKTYFLTGEVEERQDAENADITLDCLLLEPLPYELLKNYDQFRGPGAGEDLFVVQQFRATNNCGKDIKSFQYEASYTDEFDDEFVGVNGTAKLKIKAGQTKTTSSDRGRLLRQVFDSEEIDIFLTTDPSDITVSAAATQIRFADKTQLP